MAETQTVDQLAAHGCESERWTGLSAFKTTRVASLLRWALVAALGSRLVLFLVMAVATSPPPTTARLHPFVRNVARLFPEGGLLERIFLPWARWDGLWYVDIAAHGYTRPWAEAFSPLYPLVMRPAAYLFGGNYTIAGVAISLVCFLCAIALLYRLVSLDFSPSVALWTTVFLALFPTSFFFQAVYAESLFLLLTIACFYWSRQGRWALAALAGFAAVLTRSTGLLLIVPMAVYYMEARSWKLRRIDRDAAWMLLVPAGFMVWMGYLWLQLGDPLLSLRAEGHWNRQLTFPPVTLYRGIVDFGYHFDRTVIDGGWGPAGVHDFLALAVVAGVVALIWVGWRRLPPAYTAYTIVALLVPLCFPALHRPLFSVPRFALAVFPVFVTLSLMTSKRLWIRLALAVVFMAGACWLATLFARHVFIS